MTVTATRTHATPERSVKDRRAAALERLNAAAPGTVASGPRKGHVRRAKPTRRAVPRVSAPSQQLGPPPRIYYGIFVIVATFVLFGLVMVLSATSARNVGGDESPYAIFQRQALWAMLGLLVTLIVVKVPYQRWRTAAVPIAILAGGAMLLPFAPGIGAEINDATSWVRFGGISFQPSEFLKLAAIGFRPTTSRATRTRCTCRATACGR